MFPSFALILLPALGLVGCDGDYYYGGYQIYDHFPLDGQRSWEYANNDLSVTDHLEVRMLDTTVEQDGITVHEFQHFNDTTGDQILSVQWSSASTSGVQIHGYQTFDTGGGGGPGGGGDDTGGEDTGSAPPYPADLVSFDPPILFADSEMAPDESVESSGGGWDFTSTFESVDPCPNHWVGDEWETCLRIRIDDGDGDDTTGAPFAGTYWLVPRYGIAWQQTTGDTDTWVLVRAEWASDDD